MNLSDESAANATNGKHPPTPFNIDGEPITYDGNPAHVEGILHELSEWTARTGHYVTLLENNAVLLPNGKMAVDSIAAVLFVSGEKDDGGKYSFHTPCPATSERIKKFDAEAARTSSATFTAPSKMPDEHAGSFIPSKFQVQAEDLRFLNSLSQIIADSDLRSDLIKRSGRSGRAFLAEFRKEGAKATAGDKTLVVTNLESYALSGHVGALTLTSFNSFLKNFYKLQRATPPSSRKPEAAIFEMIKMVAIKDPEYRKEFKQELAIQKPANVTALTTLVREMLRSDQVYDQLDELRSGTTTRLTDAQAAAIAKAGIDSTRLGTGEARKIAEALLAKSNADPRKTDGQRPPRGNRPPGSGGVEVPRDSDGNITKWVEGMRTCRCGINGGKHLFKDCPVGGKPPSEQAARVAPQETEKPPPAAAKSTIKSTITIRL